MCLFKFFMERADRYAAQSTWRDFALVKFCLGAMGVLMGLAIPARHKSKAGILAGAVFLTTYGALMARFLPFLFEKDEEDIED